MGDRSALHRFGVLRYCSVMPGYAGSLRVSATELYDIQVNRVKFWIHG